MSDRYEKMLNCLTLIHKTMSVCSKCLECCSPEEKVLYGELSKDSARMAKRIKDHISNQQ